MKKLIFMILSSIGIIYAPLATAQNFQFIKGGGSPFNVQNQRERVSAMVTDSNKNVFAWSLVGSEQISADTFFAIQAPNNVSGALGTLMLTSYRCDGTMRFAKLINAYAGDNKPYDIIYDGAAGIYLAGHLFGTNKVIGDTVVENGLHQGMFIAKYDTSGNYQWVSFVGPDSASTSLNTGGVTSLFITSDGKIHMVATIFGGLHINAVDTTVTGTYDLTYNANGQMTGFNRWDVEGNYYLQSIKMDRSNNTLYNYYYGNETVNYGTMLNHTNIFGVEIWRDTFTSTNYIESIVPDGLGHLYATGAAANFVEPFSYHGLTVTNDIYPNGYVGVVLKMDTMRNIQWFRKTEGPNTCEYRYSEYTKSNQIVTYGGFGSNAISFGDTLSAGSNDIMFQILDTAGNKLAFKSIPGNGFFDGPSSIISDKAGSIYFGGATEDSIFAPGVGYYKNVGGTTDFFIIKYGYPCNCITAPAASYTSTITGSSVAFSYNGTSPYDSLRWDFGDGTFSNQASPVHTYSTSTGITACVTVYTQCGSAVYCNSPFGLNVGSAVSAFPGIRVYPNPASDQITISGNTEVRSYRLMNTVGQVAQQGVLSGAASTVNISSLRSGIYMLEVSGNGKRAVVRVVKE